jgi:hypothetical protein
VANEGFGPKNYAPHIEDPDPYVPTTPEQRKQFAINAKKFMDAQKRG